MHQRRNAAGAMHLPQPLGQSSLANLLLRKGYRWSAAQGSEATFASLADALHCDNQRHLVRQLLLQAVCAHLVGT